ncbi:MANSC domain-containing protein 1 [Denticeps clupeoides]|uniref:MANSC domain-containing protein n=1 Tax=Denticeps clupeoides TaxID=299321 RepID=A0AAY4EED9_9TELE|nr:MANSC domain-containing protein 1 [Denticeps clupeoides]
MASRLHCPMSFAHPDRWMPMQFFVLLAVLLQAAALEGGSDGETCYSRQHRDAIVNLQIALTRPGTSMQSDTTATEKDCVLTCCSREVKKGIKCNLAVYFPNKPKNVVNCFLFQCKSELDCPLMTSKGVNTYDIFRGAVHPTSKVSDRTTAIPVQDTTAEATTTLSTATVPSSTSTTTTTQPTTTTTTATTTTTTKPTTTTTTTTTTTKPTTTQAPTTTTTQSSTTTTRPNTTTKSTTTEPIVHEAMHAGMEPPTATTTTTTTTTTESTTTRPANPTTEATTTTTTQAPRPILHPLVPIKPPRKQNKLTRRPDTHPVKPVIAITAKSTTTTTTKPSTTATTTATTTTVKTSTTTTTVAAPTERTTSAFAAVDYELRAFGSIDPVAGAAGGKVAVSRGTWKTSLVVVVVVGLAFVTMALALLGRKIMESFDRRHYTRLELNDLHYEV